MCEGFYIDIRVIWNLDVFVYPGQGLDWGVLGLVAPGRAQLKSSLIYTDVSAIPGRGTTVYTDVSRDTRDNCCAFTLGQS